MSVCVELVMGIVAIATGSTVIGVVSCAAMASCMWLYALTEIVAFYRVGLPQTEPDLTPVRAPVHRPNQAW